MSEDSDNVVLRVRDARKRFGQVQALDGAAIDLRRGELLGLLGPNGAGKTTLLRAIAGRVRLDAGDLELFGTRLNGRNRRNGREALGIVPQEIALYHVLTARENLEAFGRLNGIPGSELKARIDWVLEWVGLQSRSREPLRNFSGGMKRRLNLACSVLHKPRVLLLDEPTVGVDPQSRERIYAMLDELRAGGMSLLLTTHHLEEAEARCQRIVIIDHGRTIASGTLGELVDRTVGRERLITLTLDRALETALPGIEQKPAGAELQARVADVTVELPRLLAQVKEAGRRVENIEVRPPSLQSVFIHLTGKELRE